MEVISTKRAKEIIAKNKQGEKPLSLSESNKTKEEKKPVDLLADADVSRFDKTKKRKKKTNKGQNRQQTDKKELKPEAMKTATNPDTDEKKAK